MVPNLRLRVCQILLLVCKFRLSRKVAQDRDAETTLICIEYFSLLKLCVYLRAALELTTCQCIQYMCSRLFSDRLGGDNGPPHATNLARLLLHLPTSIHQSVHSCSSATGTLFPAFLQYIGDLIDVGKYA